MRPNQILRREQGKHADDWLITYADVITLLLCLFVVSLSMKTNHDLPVPEILAQVSSPMAAVDIFNGVPPFPKTARVVAPFIDETPPEIIASEAAPNPPRPVSSSRADETPASAGALADPTAPTGQWSEIFEPAMLTKLDRPRLPEIALAERRGDRITTMQIDSTAFFSSGDAALSGAGKRILSDVAITLASPELAAYHISVEGHTDDSPINTAQFASNWELSTARAAAVVRFLLEQGIPARRISASGYADTFPIVPNRNADGTAIARNQAINRRVVIQLEQIDKAEQ